VSAEILYTFTSLATMLDKFKLAWSPPGAQGNMRMTVH